MWPTCTQPFANLVIDHTLATTLQQQTGKKTMKFQLLERVPFVKRRRLPLGRISSSSRLLETKKRDVESSFEETLSSTTSYDAPWRVGTWTVTVMPEASRMRVSSHEL
jgi:hypothetical protein